MKDPSPDLMTVEQVSDYLQLSTRTIYALRARNAIPFIRLGSALRFRKADVEAWLTENTTRAVR